MKYAFVFLSCSVGETLGHREVTSLAQRQHSGPGRLAPEPLLGAFPCAAAEHRPAPPYQAPLRVLCSGVMLWTVPAPGMSSSACFREQQGLSPATCSLPLRGPPGPTAGLCPSTLPATLGPYLPCLLCADTFTPLLPLTGPPG